MDKYNDERQQLIRAVLAPETETFSFEAQVRVVRAWEQLAAHLNPLIGEAGFCALYGRAVRLSASGDEWRAAIAGVRSLHTLLDTLRTSLAAMDPASSCAAHAELLENFTKLLAGLIGEAFTTRLLNTAWADRPEGMSK